MKEWVSPKYLDKTSVLKGKFARDNPFPYLFLKDFFSEKIKRVRSTLLKESFERKEKDLFSFYQTADISHSKNRILKEFYSFFASKDFLDFISQVTSQRLKSIDMSGFIYSEGDYLLPHDDRLEGRRIAYVVNLSEKFSNIDGGQLSFFSRNKIVKSFVPVFNSFVLFEVSKKSLHQVNEVLTIKQRLTLAGWFHA